MPPPNGRPLHRAQPHRRQIVRENARRSRASSRSRRQSVIVRGALKRFLSDIDLVWINGGNAFILRRAMKQSGFDMLIKSAVARDEIVYAGFSAAAVIAFDSLKGLELTDDPEDVPSGYNTNIVWEGLGFVPFALAVHC